MIFGRTYTAVKIGKTSQWFAWYPVRLANGQWAWLQKLRCKKWLNEYNRSRVRYEEL